MVNVNKLKGRIVETGITVEELAKQICVDKSTLYRRLSDDGATFLIKEADAIATALKLSKDEVNAIFFSQFVA